MARAFLSYSHVDAGLAQRLKTELDSLGVKVWAYESNLPFGNAISTEIEARIGMSDYLLVLLSDAAHSSQWVCRELGLALDLHSNTGGNPLIIGVRTSSPCHVYEFDVLDFKTGRPTGNTFDFRRHRCFNFCTSTDTVEGFADFLRPSVTYISSSSQEQQELLQASFSCYEELFPDSAERDHPECIEEWLAEARHAEVCGSPWRETYATLSVAGYVIGVAFLSTHLLRNFTFGNYFGVRRGWRRLERAECFIENVLERLLCLAPSLRAILFEADPVGFDLLDEAVHASSLRQLVKVDDLLLSLRALRRIVLYETYNSVMFLQGDGRPLPYWQPAIEEPLGSNGERQLYLMVRPISSSLNVDINEVLDFIYSDLYGDAYGGLGSVEIPGYRSYVAHVRNRVENQLRKTGYKIGPLSVSRPVRSLLQRARKEGLFDDLAL